MKKLPFALLATILFVIISACTNKKKDTTWTLLLEQQNKATIEIMDISNKLTNDFAETLVIDSIEITVSNTTKAGYNILTTKAKALTGERACYVSLLAKYTAGQAWNYNGVVTRTEIFRQSPHDINAWITDSLAKQAMPMLAIKTNQGFSVAVNNAPVYYNNYCSQYFNVQQQVAALSSGDNGQTPGMKPESMIMPDYNAEKGQIFTKGTVTPYYHAISKSQSHTFEIILLQSNATDINNLRKDVVLKVADCWSEGKFTNYMGALAFTVPYMNMRTNDSKKSKYWVIPSVEYANTQYCRDAFWISTMLLDTMAAQCLKNELDSVNHYAEYPLYIPIWAYRTILNKGEVDLAKVQKYIDVIEKHVRNGYYYSYDRNDGRQDFQYWNDMVAFDTTDVITYNQGLLAVALHAAEKMGLKTKTTAALAAKNYKELFSTQYNILPVSKFKDTLLAPDVVVPDLLSQIYLNTQLLDSNIMQQHYNAIVSKSKTPYGYKILANLQGQYLSRAAYDTKNYISQINREKMPVGKYQYGGSWTLYDLLFLINANLYKIKGADKELLWRADIDFNMGATSYECINTVTGEPWKPNMGWNSAAYYFWEKTKEIE